MGYQNAYHGAIYISAGTGHTCVIFAKSHYDGHLSDSESVNSKATSSSQEVSFDESDVILSCFGSNKFGQSTVPESINSSSNISSIVESGDEHNCVVASVKQSYQDVNLADIIYDVETHGDNVSR